MLLLAYSLLWRPTKYPTHPRYGKDEGNAKRRRYAVYFTVDKNLVEKARKRWFSMIRNFLEGLKWKKGKGIKDGPPKFSPQAQIFSPRTRFFTQNLINQPWYLHHLTASKQKGQKDVIVQKLIGSLSNELEGFNNRKIKRKSLNMSITVIVRNRRKKG